jgi:hypothetical protein
VDRPEHDLLELRGVALDDERGGDDLGVPPPRPEVVPERPLAGRDLVEHDAQPEDVEAPVDGAALQVLRRHVGEATLDHADLRDVAVVDRPRDPEVRDLHHARVAHEDVRRGHVAVHDLEDLPLGRPKLMRRVQPLRCVGDDPRADGERDPRVVDQGRQALAVDVLHRDEVDPFDDAEVHHLDHVGVGDPGQEPRLVDEHLDEGRALEVLRVDQLDREELLEALHPGQPPGIDLTHPALGEAEEELISTEGAALPQAQPRRWPRSCHQPVSSRAGS